MNFRQFCIYVILIALLFGCSSQSGTDTSSGADAWWRDVVFYEIFVRSFQDTNGDGIGDFNGITQRLDYLEELGINGIELMPIHPSPSYHGYEVTNYYAVNPQYGTMDDFKNLLDEAHKRDIRVIIDLVLNHTSSSHPFFIDANSGPDSTYRDWYIWETENPGNMWHQGNGGYYFGLFWSGMPDLNYRNPDVTAQMDEVTRYWLEDIGVDGFRLDAAKHLIEEGDLTENTTSTHEWFKNYYTIYKSINPDAYTVGEVWGAGSFLATTYKQQFDHVFNFELASGIMNSASGASNTGINSAWKFTLKDISDGDYATFLTNHDQNRVMSAMNGNEDKAKLAAFMLLTAPGTPFIYYGEEIGMQGRKPDEDIRLPMQWTSDANAGFTTGDPWRALDSNYAGVNVALEEQDPDALLNLYRTLIHIRMENIALRTGNLYLIETGSTGVYAILRSDNEKKFLVLINLKDQHISDYNLTLKDAVLPNGTLSLSTVYGSIEDTQLTVKDGKFSGYKPIDELPPYAMYLLLLK